MPATIPLNELGKQLLKAAGDGNLDEIKTLMARGAPFTADWVGYLCSCNIIVNKQPTTIVLVGNKSITFGSPKQSFRSL